jgi:3-hydroxyisobutyrate dehydrogenase
VSEGRDEAAGPSIRRVAVVGLGTMGGPMAGHLLDAGLEVTVWNRTREREEPFAALGARRAGSAREAAAGAQAIVVCVSEDGDLAAVVEGDDGIAAGIGSGAIVVDSSTVSPSVTRRLAGLIGERGGAWVDAPVSGGSEGARNGTLTAFVGGSEEAVATVRPVLDAYCRTVTHLGPVGAGQAGKAVNQVFLGAAYAGLGEALVLAEREGLDGDQIVEALGGGSARGWVLENRSRNVIDGSYPLGFRVRLHLKDLRIALDEARAVGAELPVTELVAQLQERLVDAGHGDDDTSAIARVARGEL